MVATRAVNLFTKLSFIEIRLNNNLSLDDLIFFILHLIDRLCGLETSIPRLSKAAKTAMDFYQGA
jgi:hypothetical protein